MRNARRHEGPGYQNRRDELLAAAARRFAAYGFGATSMRDIAGDVGMLAGSIYHHFPSKDALIAAVYALGVEQIETAVDEALSRRLPAWERLEAACAAHLDALLAERSYAAVLTADLNHLAPELRRRLVELRDRYEQRFVSLVDALPLPATCDRGLFRLQLLGALNWTPTWYRTEGHAPAAIAGAFLAMLRCC